MDASSLQQVAPARVCISGRAECHLHACDVGVNTCKGEGFGLVNFEHAACRVAQVVPNHTSCKELFEGYGR